MIRSSRCVGLMWHAAQTYPWVEPERGGIERGRNLFILFIFSSKKVTGQLRTVVMSN